MDKTHNKKFLQGGIIMKKNITKLGLVVIVLTFVAGHCAGCGKLFTEKSVTTEAEVKSELHPIHEITIKTDK